MFSKKQKDSVFDSVAARVEMEVGSPAAVLVTSALLGDGTAMIASRLADAFVNVGYRVVVVDIHETTMDQVDVPQATAASYNGDGGEKLRTYAEISLRDLGDRFAGSRRDVSTLVARLRSRYDYVIVNAPVFTGSMPMLFADACDTLMIAVQRGRGATGDDRRINSYLDSSAKHAIGVVSTTKAAVANFGAIARHRSRSKVSLHDIMDERGGRVSVVTGAS